ncbi:hypothetical protein Q4S25_17375, partial [Morganella morganii]
MTTKYLIESNLSEKQIEADVATFFGMCTIATKSVKAFRLLDIDEQKTGADKLFDCATPIYMQFKKSRGLRSVHEVSISSRKNRSKLEDIRNFRDINNLEQNPSLYFKLHKKAKTANELQHNILLSYENPPWSRAIYVAPLLLDKDAYYNALCKSAPRIIHTPFFDLNYSIHQRNWISYFGLAPFLKEHISIPPHERVSNDNHYYAYSESGVDISWHSPQVIKQEPSRLSDFYNNLFNTVINNEEAMLPQKELAERINRISTEFGYQPDKNDDSPISNLKKHGDWLRETYN